MLTEFPQGLNHDFLLRHCVNTPRVATPTVTVTTRLRNVPDDTRSRRTRQIHAFFRFTAFSGVVLAQYFENTRV